MPFVSIHSSSRSKFPFLRFLFVFGCAFVFSLPTHALSEKESRRLQAEWVSHKRKIVQVDKDFVLSFLGKSKVLKKAFESQNEITREVVFELLQTASENRKLKEKMTDDFSEISEEEYLLAVAPSRIRGRIRMANETRFQVMNLVEGMRQAMSHLLEVENLAERKRHQKEARFSLQLIKDQKIAIAELRAKVAKTEKTLEKLKNPKPVGNSARERIRNKVEHREKKKFEIELLKENLQLLKRVVASRLDQIAELNLAFQDQIRRAKEADLSKESVINPDYETPNLDRKKVMPILRLFEQVVNFEEFDSILESVARDLFLTADYFGSLDQSFLLAQLELARRAHSQAVESLKDRSEFDKSTEMARQAGVELKEDDFNQFVRLLWCIISIHEIELERRELEEKLSLPVSVDLDSSDQASESTDLESSDNESEGETEALSVTTTTTAAASQAWTVEIDHRVARNAERLSSEQRLKLDTLTRELQSGPVLRRHVAVLHQLRNFSKLSKLDFHCHLGESNLVAVWRLVDSDEKKINVYYLGSHPTTYKRVLKAAPSKSRGSSEQLP